jgi:HEAT repeat protein
MKYFFLIFCLILPTISSGSRLKEIQYDELELKKYQHDLKFGAPQKRWEAAEILGNSGNSKMAGPLIDALADEVPKVREYVAEALGKLCTKKSKGPLKRKLDDPYPMVRYAIAEALARLNDPAGLPICVQALRDPRAGWRRRARTAEALGILGNRGSITALVSVLDDTASARVREEAAYALGRMRQTAQASVSALCKRVDHSVEEMPSCRIAAAVALSQIQDRPGSIPCLAHCLDDPDNEVRQAISDALKDLIKRDDAIIPILIELLEPDKTREFAEAALDSFSNGGRDIPLFSKIVGSGQRRARLYAIRRLEEIKESAAQFPLVEALEDVDSIVRARAAQGLGKLGFAKPAAVPALLEFIDDTTYMVQKSVIISLGQLGDARADSAFYRIMKESRKPWQIRVIAAQACGGLPAHIIREPIFKFSRHADWKIRYLACVTMGERLDKKTKEILEYISQNEPNSEVREAARTSLGQLMEKAYGRTYGGGKPK